MIASSTYQALARKWRPQTFDAVIAQPQVTQTLRNALASGRLHHAYLFCGPRGTGKTTTARILAKALNCEKGPTPDPCNQCPICVGIMRGVCLDVLEFDAASKTGIDDVRLVTESALLAPAQARYKVFIIDEVHQLSDKAKDALLKTLEEPPRNVTFILATTEAAKVPPTIRSRALRFDFHLVDHQAIRGHLAKIAATEQMEIEAEALDIISAEAAGSIRDSQSILEQVAAYSGGTITAALTYEALGLVDSGILFSLTDAFAAHDPALALDVIGRVSQAGRDFAQFIRQLSEHLKRLLFARSLGDKFADDALSHEVLDRYRQSAHALEENDWLRLLLMSLEVGQRMRRGMPQPLLELEMFALRAAKMDRSVDVHALVERIEKNVPFDGPVRSAATGPVSTQAPVGIAPSATEDVSKPNPATAPARSFPVKSTLPPEDTPPSAGVGAVDKRPAHGGNGWIDFAPILEAICRQRPTLRALFGHAVLVRTGAGTFDLNVYHGSTFHQRQLAEKPIRDLIHAEVARVLGTGARVTTHVKEGPPPGEPSEAATDAESPTTSREDAVRSDHGLQEILRRFDGEIVE